MKLLTVFTPTYNRGYCLRNLYESLKRQTSNNFLWLVIDDGSVDNTKELCLEFQKENRVEIVYYYQQNGGKHVAHNNAVKICQTELFLCVDSDDILSDQAVETIENAYNAIKTEHILGMYMRRVYKNGENVAKTYPDGVNRVGITDLYHSYDFHGDTAIILKASLIKNCSFPVYPEERFVSEVVFYNQLNSIAPMVLFEDPIYICEYLEDGYTYNTERLMISNPYGSATANLSEAVYGKKLLYRVKNYAQYLAFLHLFQMDRKRIDIGKIPGAFIRIAAYGIRSHYVRLFERIRSKYENSNAGIRHKTGSD